MINWFWKKKQKEVVSQKRFPPVPDWQPDITQDMEQLISRMSYYTNDRSDFAVFGHGTMAVIPHGLDDNEAIKEALNALHQVFNAHPDMTPMNMDDGNYMSAYNHDVYNIILKSVVEKNWDQIDKEHQGALATDEVLITPLGHNVFDDLGKICLFGRCYMFMDAQNPQIVRIVRGSKNEVQEALSSQS